MEFITWLGAVSRGVPEFGFVDLDRDVEVIDAGMPLDVLRDFDLLAFVLLVEREFARGVSRRGDFDLSG